MSDIKTAEPMPTEESKSMPVSERLKDFIDERTELGISKYGTVLKTFNGRDCLTDALQEAIDLSQYLCQKIMELEHQIALGTYKKDFPSWAEELHHILGYSALQVILNDRIPRGLKGNCILTTMNIAIRDWRKENKVPEIERVINERKF